MKFMLLTPGAALAATAALAQPMGVEDLAKVTHVRRVLFTLNSFHMILMDILFTSKCMVAVSLRLCDFYLLFKYYSS